MSDDTTPTRRRAGRRTKPSAARQVHGARRDQEVLDAAIKVFHSRGYADASVQDIADELGILKGSLYHYIDSKEDLLFRLLEDAHREVQAILEDVAMHADAPPLERLREYIVRQVDYTTANLAKMAIYYHDADQLSEGRRKDLVARRRVHEQFVAKLIAEAQERGDVDQTLDPALTTNYLFGSMIWVYRWYKPRGKAKSADIASSLSDFVVHGLTGARS